MNDGHKLDTREEVAFALSQAAVILDQGWTDPAALASALDHNMEVWAKVRFLANNARDLTAETKGNLLKLGDFVTETTIANGVDITAEMIDTLININLQISEGILEAQAKSN